MRESSHYMGQQKEYNRKVNQNSSTSQVGKDILSLVKTIKG
jgi:hypothetical protein